MNKSYHTAGSRQRVEAIGVEAIEPADPIFRCPIFTARNRTPVKLLTGTAARQ